MIPGLLATLLAACSPADLTEQAGNKYCDTEGNCVPETPGNITPNPDFDLQQCKVDYITEVGNLLDGCQVDWAKFNKAKKTIDDAACDSNWEGSGQYAHRALLAPVSGGLTQYCKNVDDNGNLTTSR